jgi:hypothetical protein
MQMIDVLPSEYICKYNASLPLISDGGGLTNLCGEDTQLSAFII